MSEPIGHRVLLAAHGTRDPHGRRVIAELAERVASAVAGQGVRVRLGWLEHARPSVAEALAADAPDQVLPLLLGDGYHVHEDLVRLLADYPQCRLDTGIGAGEPLTTALADRLAEAGWSPGQPVALAAAGSRLPGWRAEVARSARLLAARLDIAVRPGFLSGAGESVPQAVDAVQQDTGRIPAVSAYLLAPGRFASSLATQAPGVLSAPLGVHPELVRLLASRCALRREW